ncbi:MAG: PH domain-containing protein [Clostridia bacterium]|nr:PH domain-containing protein [Clostridia bacterium]
MKQKFKVHPLFIFNTIKPFLFVLVLPLIKGVYQYLRYRNLSGVLSLEIISFAVILFIAYIKYRFTRILVYDDRISIRTGVLFIKETELPRSAISSVRRVQSLFDAVFGAVTYQINTEAGKRGKADFEFKLSKKSADYLSDYLYNTKNERTVRFSLYKLAFLAATTSSAFTGILISVPVINKLGKLLGIALNQVLFNRINEASGKMNKYFPPIVNMVTLVLLFGYIVSFVYSFLKNLNFRLSIREDMVKIKSGFLVRYSTVFKKRAVKDVTVEQTPFMRIFKRYSIKVSVGGYGGGRKENAVLVPCGKRTEISSQFSAYFPFLKSEGKAIRPKRSPLMKRRFLSLPMIYSLLTAIIAAILIIKFPPFGRLTLFVAFIAISVILYYTDLCLFNYRFGKVRLCEKNVYARSSIGFKTQEIYCPSENIGQIKITQYAADRKYGTCKLRLTVRSEGADSIKVRNLDYKRIIEEINKTFKTQV